MEQHPVPRNISGFQFKLIGDMTVRQFAYLGAGVFMAYLTFRFAPFPPILRMPLAGIIGLAGVAFAFFPIQERPLDKWLILFFKSITSPTQFLWRKEEIIPDILSKPSFVRLTVSTPTNSESHQDAKNKLKAYLSTLPTQSHERINLHEKKYMEATLSLFQQVGPLPQGQPSISPQTASSFAGQPALAPIPVTSAQPFVAPTVVGTPQGKPTTSTIPVSTSPSSPLSPTAPFVPTPATTQKSPHTDQPMPTPAPTTQRSQTQALQPIIGSQPFVANSPQGKPTTYNQQSTTSPSSQSTTSSEVAQLLAEKERLFKELEHLKQQTAQLAQPTVIQPVQAAVPKQPTIVTIPAQAIANEVGLQNLSHTPNLIIGIVKDPQRRVLPNVIITIKDEKSMPIRALKTNKLGQFETATPLPNGTYLLEVEDPMGRFVFDTAQITLSGKVFLPIEITAKGEKEMMRERLTKELFGNAGVNANI